MLRADIFDDANNTGKAIHEFTLLAETPEARNHAELRQVCLVRRAGLLLRIGDIDQALDDSNQAISILPEASAYFIRGHVYRRRDQLAKAVADYTRAIELNPDEPNLFIQRAEAYDELGMTADATRDRHSAQALTNSSPSIVTEAESKPVTLASSEAEGGAPGTDTGHWPPIVLVVVGCLFLLIGFAAAIGILVVLGSLLLLGGIIWALVLSSSKEEQQGLASPAPSPPGDAGRPGGDLFTRFMRGLVKVLVAYVKFAWVVSSAIVRAFR